MIPAIPPPTMTMSFGAVLVILPTMVLYLAMDCILRR